MKVRNTESLAELSIALNDMRMEIGMDGLKVVSKDERITRKKIIDHLVVVMGKEGKKGKEFDKTSYNAIIEKIRVFHGQSEALINSKKTPLYKKIATFFAQFRNKFNGEIEAVKKLIAKADPQDENFEGIKKELDKELKRLAGITEEADSAIPPNEPTGTGKGSVTGKPNAPERADQEGDKTKSQPSKQPSVPGETAFTDPDKIAKDKTTAQTSSPVRTEEAAPKQTKTSPDKKAGTHVFEDRTLQRRASSSDIKQQEPEKGKLTRVLSMPKITTPHSPKRSVDQEPPPAQPVEEEVRTDVDLGENVEPTSTPEPKTSQEELFSTGENGNPETFEGLESMSSEEKGVDEKLDTPEHPQGKLVEEKPTASSNEVFRISDEDRAKIIDDPLEYLLQLSEADLDKREKLLKFADVLSTKSEKRENTLLHSALCEEAGFRWGKKRNKGGTRGLGKRHIRGLVFLYTNRRDLFEATNKAGRTAIGEAEHRKVNEKEIKMLKAEIDANAKE